LTPRVRRPNLPGGGLAQDGGRSREASASRGRVRLDPDRPSFVTFLGDDVMSSLDSADRRHILVVDDEPYIGRIIQLKLEQGPYEVELASDGRAALARLRADEPIDLVLLDIVLPHTSGLDVLASLRAFPHRKTTPVIMLTAKGQDTDREQADALGVTDFLTKPFSPKKLLARIDQLFL